MPDERTPSPTVERVYEMSAIRRGRQATSPTWFVTLPSGVRWRFMRKRDALAFAEAGGCADHGSFCRNCNGYVVRS